MIEILLILVAVGVVYYLYITLKDYLDNSESQKRFSGEYKKAIMPQVVPTLQSQVVRSEYGILTGILGYVANADGEICVLEREIALSLLGDMSKEMRKIGSQEEVLEELKKIFETKQDNIQALCQDFSHFTKGEYKKKVKVVEFCFVLGYADGILNEPTKDAIIDIAALLELDNEDFNALYDDFNSNNEVEITLEEAKEIFGEYQDLHTHYQELVAKSKQNIVDEKNLNKPITQDQITRLRKIQKAYDLLRSQR